MISKKIMDKTEGIKRGSASQSVMENYDMPIQEYNLPNVKYNIPQEFLQEAPSQQPLLSQPRENTKPVGTPSVEAIKNSRLPDEIKRLMIEHPIAQPAQMGQATLSPELIEKASRLMKENDNNYVPESAKPKPQTKTNTSGIDYNVIKQMIEEAVDNALKQNGLIIESTEKTNEVFSFKVGKHIFEGKVTKIKKLS